MEDQKLITYSKKTAKSITKNGRRMMRKLIEIFGNISDEPNKIKNNNDW